MPELWKAAVVIVCDLLYTYIYYERFNIVVVFSVFFSEYFVDTALNDYFRVHRTFVTVLKLIYDIRCYLLYLIDPELYLPALELNVFR